MKPNKPDRIKLTVNIPEDVYRGFLRAIESYGLGEEGVIQRIIGAGLLKLKIDVIKEENSSLSFQIENLRNETKRLIEENKKFERLCSESRRDSDYICKRLEKLNSENEGLEILLRQQSSTEQEGNK
jgi:FtsZ-binding cell division protein ZapB